MNLRKIASVALFSVGILAVVPIGAGVAGAKSAPTLSQVVKGERELQTCVAAMKSKKVVTKSAHAACAAGDITAPIGCPKKSGVELFANVVGSHVGSAYYLMTVGHRPEKASEPAGAKQTAYVCQHGTFVGAPPPYS